MSDEIDLNKWVGTYKLNPDKTITPCSVMEWSKQLEEMRESDGKHMAQELVEGKRVSTVWIGLDHQYGEGEPLLFETMVVDPPNRGQDIYCDRYSTWDEAEAGHKKAVEWVKNGCRDEEVDDE